MNITKISKSGNFCCAGTILKNHVDLDMKDKVMRGEYYCSPGNWQPAFFQGYDHGIFASINCPVGQEVLALDLTSL